VGGLATQPEGATTETKSTGSVPAIGVPPSGFAALSVSWTDTPTPGGVLAIGPLQASVKVTVVVEPTGTRVHCDVFSTKSSSTFAQTTSPLPGGSSVVPV